MCVPLIMVRAEAIPQPIAQPLLAIDDRENELEGIELHQPQFSEAAQRLAGEFIRLYTEASPHTRLGLRAPLVAPLFAASISRDEASYRFNGVFNRAARQQVSRDFRRYHRSGISFHLLLHVAQDLGTANFCEVRPRCQ